MPIFERGQIVRVPFRCPNSDKRSHRPALVISAGPTRGKHPLLWVLMITSAKRAVWPDDIDVGPAYRDFGLPVPSRIRVVKVATIVLAEAEIVGRVTQELLETVDERLDRIMGRT